MGQNVVAVRLPSPSSLLYFPASLQQHNKVRYFGRVKDSTTVACEVYRKKKHKGQYRATQYMKH